MSFIELDKLNQAPDVINDPFWTSITSIQFGELIEAGFYNYSTDDTWKFDYYDLTQYTRLCKKFADRYYFREISVLPLARWKKEYLRKLNEIMPKYKLLYARFADGVNLLQESNDYGKSRNIYSDFPQTNIAGSNQDYASNGTDSEYENVHEGNIIDKMKQMEYYNDIDVLILNELEYLFSQLLTEYINGI